MLNKPTYQEWTKAFAEGSSYQGSWEKGSEIRFVGEIKDGQQEGMFARIKETGSINFFQSNILA